LVTIDRAELLIISAFMRTSLCCGVLLLATVCAGDTIRLKNGRSILADSVTDNGKSVEYAIGEDTYSISKNLVDRIDAGGVPGVTHHDDVAIATPTETIRGGEQIFGKVIRDGKVDIDSLAAVEKIGSPE